MVRSPPNLSVVGQGMGCLLGLSGPDCVSHLRLFVAAEADLRDQGLPADGAEEGRQMCAAALAQGLSPGCFLKLDSSRCLTVRLWDSELPCQT